MVSEQALLIASVQQISNDNEWLFRCFTAYENRWAAHEPAFYRPLVNASFF